MVVRKASRWSPWAPSIAKRKYVMTIRVIELVGSLSASSSASEGEVVAVRIRWRGPSTGGYLRKKRKEAVGTTGEKPVSFTGVIGFGDDESSVLRNVCCYSRRFDDPSEAWQVSFSVLHGFVDDPPKEKKLEEIGAISVNLTDWIQISETLQNGPKEYQHQRKKLSIPLNKDDYATDAILHVDVDISCLDDTSEVNRMVREESKRNEETGDGSCTFEPDMELDKRLQLADDEEKVCEYKNRARATSSTSSSSDSSEASSPDLQLRSASKRSFLSWRRRSKSGSKSNAETEDQASSNTVKKEESLENADPIGNWESRELMSRDGRTKLKAQTFFASIDQRDESAGGESACTALVAVIADVLHSKGATTPNRSEFDALIREGSSQWRSLCNDASYIARFPNKHFDLDTVLQANVRPISVLPDKSYVGFFQPESFESLRGAMSFDDIWNEVARDVGGTGERVYVVSWNDHFFVLKAEAEAYYVVDTLGERLYEGCSRAYILRFDESTVMYGLPAEGKDGEEMVCTGKECCREFIKRFLAAIPLREELEVEEKGMGNANTALHHRLQIEFHLTETVILMKV